jgi:ATP-dependent RNA helicase SUPV3L1/SUV3
MPTGTDAAFVAIDEVQLAADLERGHVFTDRLLNMRGSQETLLLGASTMRGIIERLLPGVHIVTRPRMSLLTYAGQKKITRLPERSAIVSFSADDVYATAELIRRQRGGAAVVLGALSPRTRNKQVEIYQSGDVDFLIATDAIGMGLNLELDHVAFAGKRKFDGYQFRDLNAAELGQIAGRAGRYLNDGTFGVTAQVEPFPDNLVQALETHTFEPVRTLQWRSAERDFSSVAALIASLDQPATVAGLTKAPPAPDQTALLHLVKQEEIADRLSGPAELERLWDVCRLPDYRRIAPGQHAEIIENIFSHLIDNGAVPDDWIASQIKHANRIDGDIDTLSARIAQIRTWTFVANQPDWLSDPVLWREETRKIEDALSDALHERLTQRFIDRRTSVLMRRLKENTMLEAEITASGDVIVEGQHIGVLNGFRFTPAPDTNGSDADAKAVRSAAQKALAGAIADRAGLIARAEDKDILLSDDGFLRWKGDPVGRLNAGDNVLKPDLIILADEHLTGPTRDQVENRLRAWLDQHVGTVLKPLFDLQADESLSGQARGIAYRLVESLGILDRRDVLDEVRALDQDTRAILRRNGVRFGAYHIYIPLLLKPGPSTLLARLRALADGDIDRPGIAEISAVSASGRTSTDIVEEFDKDIYRQFGFRIYGRRAVRIDILERLADLIRPALSWRADSDSARPEGAIEEGRGFMVTPAMTSLLGASGEDMSTILKGLGYRVERKPAPAAAEGGAGETGEPEPAASSDAPENMKHEAEASPQAGIADQVAAAEPGSGVGETAESETASEDGGQASATAGDPATPAEPAPDEDAAAADEPAMIEIWRPGGQRRQNRPDRAVRQAPGGKGQDNRGRRGKGGPKGGKTKGRGPGKPRQSGQPGSRPPRERAVDPDSPFAALAALKNDLENSDKS